MGSIRHPGSADAAPVHWNMAVTEESCVDTSLLSSLASLAPARLSDTARLYALEGAAPLDALHVECFRRESALSDCGHLGIDALSHDAGLPLADMLGQPLTLLTTQADGTRSRVSGIVREARLLGADGGLARYRLDVVPWLWLLGEGRHSRVFQGQSVLDIVETVFADYTGHAAWTITADARQTVSALRPRSYAVQYRESDRAFVERLLAEEGLGYTFVEDADAPAGHALVIFADSTRLPEDARSAASLAGLRFHRAAAVEENDTLQALGRQGALGPAGIHRLSWDYKAMAATSASVPVAGAEGGESYDPAGAYAFADSREADHYARLAAQAHEARQQRWVGRGTVRGARVGTRFRLAQSPWQAADQTLPAGFLWTRLTEVGINNLPESVRHAVHQHLGPAPPVGAASAATGTRRHRATEAKAVSTEEPAAKEALWAQAEATGYAQHFEALDQAVPWRPALADEHGLRLNPRPTAPGVQTAIVVGPEGETAPGASGPLHTDKLGRLKVKFHWMETGASCWLRSTQRHAGPGRGAQFLPRIGQEVLVNFLGGDIDRPIIVGALYNGQGEGGIAPSPGAGESAPSSEAYPQAGDSRASAQGNLAGGASPAWHGQSPGESGHANAAALSGIKTRGFDGQGHNQLVFDDSDGQGRVQLATTQAATALNLGYLIHQQDNYRGSFRGRGLELRSDGYGAVRGHRGLLLTTWAANPAEPAADATAVGALLTQHAQLADTLSGAAGTHQTVRLAGHEGSAGAGKSALSDQHAPLAALHDSAVSHVTGEAWAEAAPDQGDTPHSRDALTTLAGRAGIASVAGQSLHHAAGETLNLGAGQHLNLGAAGQLRVHANQAIGLVAGAQQANGTGLGLIAGKGALDVQAQHDTLAMRAKQTLKLVSAHAELEMAAKQTVHLATEGGAYLHIEGGHITFGAPGKLSVKAGNHKMVGGTHLSREMNQWGEAKFDQRVKLMTRSGKPAPNQRYEIHRADGAVISGVTDSEGWTELQNGLSLDGAVVQWLGDA